MSTLIGKVNDIPGVFEDVFTKLRLFHTDTNTKKLYELDVNTLTPIKTASARGNFPRGLGGGFDGKKLLFFHAEF